MTNLSTSTAVQERTRDRAYPVQPLDGDDDSRFNMGLLYEVIKVIERHGYPELTGLDMVDLQGALYRFLYRGDSTR